MLLLGLALVVSPAPAKLFVITNNGIAVTEFRSMAVCLRAADDLKRQARANAEATKPQGYRIVQYAPITTYCVTG